MLELGLIFLVSLGLFSAGYLVGAQTKMGEEWTRELEELLKEERPED